MVQVIPKIECAHVTKSHMTDAKLSGTAKIPLFSGRLFQSRCNLFILYICKFGLAQHLLHYL